jgi:catechol 2,3-dioxygenase-like lactoylglutathione lyase family enzyme
MASTPESWPGPIYAITLFAEDLEATKRFYQDVFALPVVYEDDNSAVFKFGETLINLLKATEAKELIEPAPVATREAGSRVQFTINVDDVDATCAELTTRGVTLLNGPMDRPWGIRTASFMDPGGHIWEIAH